VDCVIVPTRTRMMAAVVHECLELTQNVAVADPGRSAPTQAATWRKCQSFMCNRGKCDSRASTELEKLMDAFLAEFPRPTNPAAPTSGAARITPPAVSVKLLPESSGRNALLFYVIYITACVAVALRWEYCRILRQ
jgi:hypothetical protein